jgi:hypothetical protein
MSLILLPPAKSTGRSPPTPAWNSSLLTSMMSPCTRTLCEWVCAGSDTWLTMRDRRVLDIDDRGALRRVHVADKGMAALGGDLAAARNVEPGEMAKQRVQVASPPITWTSRR